MNPTALIVRTAGTNCDRELAHAFELAGAAAWTAHVNQLAEDPALLDRADLIGLPGGFSHGDDIAAGRIFANRLRHRLADPLRAAVHRGVPIIGICNGFQVLTKMGLLPFPTQKGPTQEGPTREGTAARHEQVATLTDNANTGGRFVAKWAPMRAEPDSVCIWTRSLKQGDAGRFDLPIAHGEGRFIAPEAVLDRIEAGHQVALRYDCDAAADPNGSARHIAGLCDPTGLVLGVMPHPERFTDPTHHPAWTRRGDDWLHTIPAGLRFFQDAVEYVAAR